MHEAKASVFSFFIGRCHSLQCTEFLQHQIEAMKKNQRSLTKSQKAKLIET